MLYKMQDLESGAMSFISRCVDDFLWVLRKVCTSLFFSFFLFSSVCPPIFFFLVCSHNKSSRTAFFFFFLTVFLFFLDYCHFLLNSDFWNKNKAVCPNFHRVLLIYSCYDLLLVLPDFI